MVPTLQWVMRWGVVVVLVVGTLIYMVGMASPFWVKDEARPSGFPYFVDLLRQNGVDPGHNATLPGGTRSVTARVGLWRWCVSLTLAGGHVYTVCDSPGTGNFPGWWRACQALAVVGSLMGALACVCGGLEIYYTRRGSRFSGLAVLCAICCFVAAVGMGLSHGMFATKYSHRLPTLLHLRSAGAAASLYPATLDWAFGVGAAGATLIGSTGIVLVAFITRTYPTYQRAENVVV